MDRFCVDAQSEGKTRKPRMERPTRLRPHDPAGLAQNSVGRVLLSQQGNVIVMHALYKKADELSKVVVEAKAVAPCDLQRFRMQLLSYLKLLDRPLGLVINFGESTLGKRAIRRVILKGADT